MLDDGDLDWLEQFEWCGVHDVAIGDMRRNMLSEKRLIRELRQSFDLYQDGRGSWKINGVTLPCPANAMPELAAILKR